MQKFHTLLAWLILTLLLVHIALGTVTMLTAHFILQTQFVYLFLCLVLLHAALALWKVFHKKGARSWGRYFSENKTYWLRVGTGVSMLVLVWFHMQLWTMKTGFGVLPKPFGTASLVIQLLFAAVLGVHILLNLKPLLIDTGLPVSGGGRKLLTAALVLFVAVALIGAILYYLGVQL